MRRDHGFHLGTWTTHFRCRPPMLPAPQGGGYCAAVRWPSAATEPCSRGPKFQPVVRASRPLSRTISIKGRQVDRCRMTRRGAWTPRRCLRDPRRGRFQTEGAGPARSAAAVVQAAIAGPAGFVESRNNRQRVAGADRPDRGAAWRVNRAPVRRLALSSPRGRPAPERRRRA